jgi:lipopolysaccharide export LptBFGC system permease protein LptF
VHNYLFPDGLFIFDINGKGKFERVYANEVYTYEGEDSFLIWENDYRSHSGLCDFYITLFKKEEDGRYVRFDEMQTERAYSLKTIRKYLAETGFEYIGAYSDFDETQADDEDERIYFVARCIKKEQI